MAFTFISVVCYTSEFCFNQILLLVLINMREVSKMNTINSKCRPNLKEAKKPVKYCQKQLTEVCKYY